MQLLRTLKRAPLLRPATQEDASVAAALPAAAVAVAVAAGAATAACWGLCPACWVRLDRSERRVLVAQFDASGSHLHLQLCTEASLAYWPGPWILPGDCYGSKELFCAPFGAGTVDGCTRSCAACAQTMCKFARVLGSACEHWSTGRLFMAGNTHPCHRWRYRDRCWSGIPAVSGPVQAMHTRGISANAILRLSGTKVWARRG